MFISSFPFANSKGQPPDNEGRPSELVHKCEASAGLLKAYCGLHLSGVRNVTLLTLLSVILLSSECSL